MDIKHKSGNSEGISYQILKHTIASNKFHTVKTAIIERHYTPVSQASVIQVKQSDNEKWVDITFYLEDSNLDIDLDEETAKLREKWNKKYTIEKEDRIYTVVTNPIITAREHFISLLMDMYDHNFIKGVERNFNNNSKVVYLGEQRKSAKRRVNYKGKKHILLN